MLIPEELTLNQRFNVGSVWSWITGYRRNNGQVLYSRSGDRRGKTINNLLINKIKEKCWEYACTIGVKLVSIPIEILIKKHTNP